MKLKIPFSPAAFPALLAAAFAALAATVVPVHAAAPAAQVLIRVDDAEKMDPEWKARVCALLPQPCEQASLQLHRLRGASKTAGFTVLAEKPLAMAEVSRDASGAWKLGKLYDFSAYKHSEMPAESTSGADRTRLSLAPALYPIGPSRWAAGVLLTFSEMYSGGGAGFTTADFVPLEEAGDPGQTSFKKPVHAGVPFSCSKMVRACFSEKEYRNSPHCHDETTGSLRIAYKEGAKAAEPYRWEYLWRETEWPSGEPAAAAVTTSNRFSDGSGSANWCGGPQ